MRRIPGVWPPEGLGCSLLRHWGGQLGRCAEQIRLHRVELLIPPGPDVPESLIIGDALESWADPISAATFLDEYREFGVPVMHYTHLTVIAQAWSDNWQDRAKARSFVAEAGRIQQAWASRFPGTSYPRPIPRAWADFGLPGPLS